MATATAAEKIPLWRVSARAPVTIMWLGSDYAARHDDISTDGGILTEDFVQSILIGLTLYGTAGTIFALQFSLWGARAMDHGTHDTDFGFRLTILKIRGLEKGDAIRNYVVQVMQVMPPALNSM